MIDDNDIEIKWNPVVRSSEEISRYIREVPGDADGSTRTKLARDIAQSLEKSQPELFTGGYEALSRGTSFF